MNASTALALAQLHVVDSGFEPGHLPILLHLRGRLAEAGKQSAKAAQVQEWMDAMILTAALVPDQLTQSLVPPPHSFADVVVECAQILQSPQPPTQ